MIRAPSPASARQGSSDQVSNQDGLSDYTITASFVTAPREEFSDYTPIQSLETFETPNRPRTPPGRVESIILGGSQVAPSSEPPRVTLESIVTGATRDKAHADKGQDKAGETAEEHQYCTWNGFKACCCGQTCGKSSGRRLLFGGLSYLRPSCSCM